MSSSDEYRIITEKLVSILEALDNHLRFLPPDEYPQAIRYIKSSIAEGLEFHQYIAKRKDTLLGSLHLKNLQRR